MARYGLSRERLKDIIIESVNSNPDLKYYINNDYIDELVDLMTDGVARAIEANTKEVIDDIDRESRSHFH